MPRSRLRIAAPVWVLLLVLGLLLVPAGPAHAAADTVTAFKFWYVGGPYGYWVKIDTTTFHGTYTVPNVLLEVTGVPEGQPLTVTAQPYVRWNNRCWRFVMWTGNVIFDDSARAEFVLAANPLVHPAVGDWNVVNVFPKYEDFGTAAGCPAA